jgi:hypothetical protein
MTAAKPVSRPVPIVGVAEAGPDRNRTPGLHVAHEGEFAQPLDNRVVVHQHVNIIDRVLDA